jgi:hypothetical protein
MSALTPHGCVCRGTTGTLCLPFGNPIRAASVRCRMDKLSTSLCRTSARSGAPAGRRTRNQRRQRVLHAILPNLQALRVLVILMSSATCGRSPTPAPATAPPPSATTPAAPAPAATASTVASPAAPATASAATTPAATAPAPPPPTKCAADTDCNFAAGAQPARCVVGPAPAADPSAAKPDGSCVCFDGACALRPNGTRVSEEPCNPDRNDCEIDLPTARCASSIPSSDLRYGRSHGPLCKCQRKDQRCHLYWFEPIPCQTTEDCWVSESPVTHSIRRPARLRRHKFRGCVDGEHVPECTKGRCELIGLTC